MTTTPKKMNMHELRRARRRNERGEGVISLAIGVLIMAFLGAGMWVFFDGMMEDTQDKVSEQVDGIGSQTP